MEKAYYDLLVRIKFWKATRVKNIVQQSAPKFK